MNQFWVHKMCSDSKVIFTSKTRLSCQLLRVTIPWSWGGGEWWEERGGDCTDYFQTQHFSFPPHRCGLAAIFSTREKEQWNVNASTLCTILVFLLFWWEFSLQLFSPRLRNFEYCIEWNVRNITRHVHTPYSSDVLRILNFIHLLYC